MRLAALAAPLIALALAAPTGAAGQGIEGSYRVVVCRMECDPERAADPVASGVVVLTGDIPDAGAAPTLLRRRAYERSWRYFEDESGRGINGCFAIANSGSMDATFVGIITNGYTRWALDPAAGRLTFPLYYSPDASYDVTLVRVGRHWVGRGASQSAIAEFTGDSHPQEFVVMHRIGPPEVERCFAAIGSPEGLRPVR